MSKRSRVGWANPRPRDSKSRSHYFAENGRSLCGQWLVHGLAPRDGQPVDAPGNCPRCAGALAALARAGKGGGARRVGPVDRLLQLLVDADAVARLRGDRGGLCDSLDADGRPAPSERLAAALREAGERGILPRVSTGR